MRWLLAFYRVDPLSYSFISGIFVSIAANLFTGIYSADAQPVRAPALLLAAGLALGSAIVWIVVAAEAQRFGRLVSRMLGTGVEREQAETDAMANRGIMLLVSVIAAALLSVVSLTVLVPWGVGNTSSQAVQGEAPAQSAIPARK